MVKLSQIAVAALLCLPPLSARAQAEPELVGAARLHDRRATELYTAGDYGASLSEMEAAQALLPATSRLYNMASCHERLGNRQQAMEHFERFVAAEDAPADRRARAEEHLERLRGEAQAEAHEPAEPDAPPPTPVERDPGEGDPGEPDEPPPTPVEPERGGLAPWGFYAALGLTVASGAALVALGAVTLSLHDDWRDMSPSDAGLEEAQSEGRAYALGTNVLIGVTSAAALSTVLLAVFTRWSPEAPAVTLLPSPTGLALAGRL